MEVRAQEWRVWCYEIDRAPVVKMKVWRNEMKSYYLVCVFDMHDMDTP
jgi:hypothetical protein